MAVVAHNRFTLSGKDSLADQNTSSTVLTNITDLRVRVQANEEKSFSFMIIYQQSNVLDSIKLGLTAPANPSILSYEITIPDTLTSIVRSANQAATGTLTATANADFIGRISGFIKNGSNVGSLQAQYASANGLGTCTIRAQSNVISWDVYP